MRSHIPASMENKSLQRGKTELSLYKKSYWLKKKGLNRFCHEKKNRERDKGREGSRTELTGEHSNHPDSPVLWCKCNGGPGPDLLSPRALLALDLAGSKPSSAYPGKVRSGVVGEGCCSEREFTLTETGKIHHVLKERRDSPGWELRVMFSGVLLLRYG